MKTIGVAKHVNACSWYLGGCFVSFRRWGLGVIVHDWGVRFLAGPWHVCFHLPSRKDRR